MTLLKQLATGVLALITILSVPLTVVTGIGLWYAFSLGLLWVFIGSLCVTILTGWCAWQYPTYREWLVMWFLPF